MYRNTKTQMNRIDMPCSSEPSTELIGWTSHASCRMFAVTWGIPWDIEITNYLCLGDMGRHAKLSWVESGPEYGMIWSDRVKKDCGPTAWVLSTDTLLPARWRSCWRALSPGKHFATREFLVKSIKEGLPIHIEQKKQKHPIWLAVPRCSNILHSY